MFTLFRLLHLDSVQIPSIDLGHLTFLYVLNCGFNETYFRPHLTALTVPSAGNVGIFYFVTIYTCKIRCTSLPPYIIYIYINFKKAYEDYSTKQNSPVDKILKIRF